MKLTAISADMAPALSQIKSPKRPRDYESPVTNIPDIEPAPKKHKADQGILVHTILKTCKQRITLF